MKDEKIQVEGQLSIFDLLNIPSDIDKTYSAQEIDDVVNRLLNAKKKAEKREKEEQRIRQEKERVEKAKAEGHRVIMVGDGINDSPALSASDAGIAISDGAEIARQIADITIGSDDLASIVILREISELLMKRIRFNYRTIVGFNTALIALGIAGIMPPATSAMLHNGSTVVLGVNSMTDLRTDRRKK